MDRRIHRRYWMTQGMKVSILLIVALALLAACQPIVSPASQPNKAMPTITQEQTDAIDAVIEGMMTELGVPGAALGIVQNGELVYAKGYGVTEIGTGNLVTPQTIFNTASNAKTLTATAIMQLVEAGKVDLDQPITTYLPEFQMNDERYREITVRQLLSHRAAIPDFDWTAPGFYDTPYNGDDALEALVQNMGDVELLGTPGTEFSYTTMGFSILGDLISKVSGLEYTEYIRTHILDPLDMQATHQLRDELNFAQMAQPHIPGPDGNWIVNPTFPYAREEGPGAHYYTSVEDMAKSAIVHLQQGSGANALLTPASYAAMWTKITDAPFPPPEDGYGLGWMIGEYGGHRVVGHGGLDLGYNAFMSLLPDDNMGVILMANQSDAVNLTSLPAFFMREPILDILLGATSAP